MRLMEQVGGVVQKLTPGKSHYAYTPLKVKSGTVWVNQTGLPAETISTLNRIMCDIWPEELWERYIDRC